jgi:SAM-dependent methyltransferase
MRLGALRRHWERLARRDPYWAVLTAADKRGGRWNVDEFFASGVEEIDAVLQRARERGLDPPRGRALDFGCGAGRLTQALAARFERCDGVDVSDAMVRLARSHNQFGERCTYHLNTAPNLALFPEAAFDFVYTTLVLQHMAPQLSTGYIGELVRVLKPNGLLVFQLPSARSTAVAPAAATRTAARQPLPASAFAAALDLRSAPVHVTPREEVNLEVVVGNRSPHVWPSLAGPLGRYRVNVANRWLSTDGQVIVRDDGRCPLEYDLVPGAETTAMLVVKAPLPDGHYQLEIDLVQEDVAWFGERGSPTLRWPVTVGAPLERDATPPALPEPPKFSERHPRAFAVMRATGFRDAYWAWRRGLDRVKRGRDAAIVWTRQTFTVPRLINWWRRGPFTPRMEMHCVAEADVAMKVTQTGGCIVAVERELTPGYVSCRYWVTTEASRRRSTQAHAREPAGRVDSTPDAAHRVGGLELSLAGRWHGSAATRPSKDGGKKPVHLFGQRAVAFRAEMRLVVEQLRSALEGVVDIDGEHAFRLRDP